MLPPPLVELGHNSRLIEIEYSRTSVQLWDECKAVNGDVRLAFLEFEQFIESNLRLKIGLKTPLKYVGSS